VDRVLADVADSFEEVWHDRTRLYEEVLRLRQALGDKEAAADALRADIDRINTDHERALAQLAEYRSSEQSASDEERREGNRLLEEIRGGRTAGAEQRKELLEFLLDALREIGPPPSNGAATPARGDDPQPHEPGLEEAGGRAEGIRVVPPPQ
jgi:septal ring factor EnvC (AmiA/AmiB activator)